MRRVLDRAAYIVVVSKLGWWRFDARADHSEGKATSDRSLAGSDSGCAMRCRQQIGLVAVRSTGGSFGGEGIA